MSKEERSLSVNVNGHSKVPPGFRFHPTEEELLQYYLRKKLGHEKIDLDVIPEVDLNKLEPWDIQEKCNIGSNVPQNDWYFFSHKDKKYPTGTRTNRATTSGFWKATGRDKVIHSSLQRIGMRKTLVFYKGRAPHGQKSDWIMHEYRLDDIIMPTQDSNASRLCDICTQEEGWVVCRVFKKKHYQKSFEIPQRSQLQLRSNKDDVLEQLLEYMDGGSCKHEMDNFSTTFDVVQQFMDPINDTLTPLPGLDSCTDMVRMSSTAFDQGSGINNSNPVCDDYNQCKNWADVDKFVASELDGKMEETKYLSCYGDCNEPVSCRPNEEDLWSLGRSTFDPLRHLSV